MPYIIHTCTAGKIASWEACKDDAIRRDSFWPRRQAFLEALPPAEQERLEKLSAEPRDDSKGEAPGSARGDEEERLFMASLSEEERRFVEGHKGLGNSQKAEVAWLEKQGYAYEEVDVRDFELERPGRSSGASSRSSNAAGSSRRSLGSATSNSQQGLGGLGPGSELLSQCTQ